MRRAIWRAVAWTGAAVVVGVLAWSQLPAHYRTGAPEVDPQLRRAIQPVVHDALLDSLRKEPHGYQQTRRSELKPRWFCVERIIEIRHQRGELRAGVQSDCEEFARSGDHLLAGTGEVVPWIFRIKKDSDGYRVLGKETGPDGAGSGEWIDREFSEAGAAELDDGPGWTGDAEIEAVARRHFDLPADAKVVGG
ncbi:hypothetical protein [Streptomyces marispadix]|uniref:Secreted protein n=1 Tax=Streptomyces marispadix TaxID=2922868 RepID=A0ABS9SUA5_9ACTN|nr:hypothetical protein [Streptomyces marispadix]MCH6159869.1 hypothetical protein [Streptomyces marispadix]